MKKSVLLLSCLFIGLFSPVAALADDHEDRNFTPFAYHGSVTRITPDGWIRDRGLNRDHPHWPWTRVRATYSKAKAPSGRPASQHTGLSKFIAKLCPFWSPAEPEGEY